MIVGNIIPHNQRLRGNATAIVIDGQDVSFAEYAERCYRLANALIERGVGHQERVAIYAQNCPEYLEVFGAGEVAGLVINTVNFRLAGPELHYVLSDADPAVIVFQANYADAVDSIRGALDGVCAFVQIGGKSVPPWCEPYEAFLATGLPTKPAQHPDPTDTAYLIYTSGTTGRPKGAMLGQRAQWLTGLMLGYDFGLTPNDRWLCVMPLFHVGAKYWQLAVQMAAATLHLHRRFDAEAVVRAIEHERITITHFAPTMLQAILDLPDLSRRDLSSLHTISYGAAPMAEPLLRRAMETLGPIFVQRYGSTEAAAVTSLEKVDHVLDGTPEQSRLLISAGQPNLMTELKIVRTDGTECEPDEAGELLIHNPDLVMQGYWRNAEATAEAFRDGWFYTGDVGTLDECGYLTILDRIKDMIISGGENIYPREVEEALIGHVAVENAAVIGIPNDKWGETVLAFVVASDGQEVGETELIEYCRTRIASYKKPSRIEFIDALPYLASGKVDKVKLREPYWIGRERRV